jgi:hypothetical protein
MTKMTYAKAIDLVLAKIDLDLCSTIDADDAPQYEEAIERLNALKASLAKRNSAGSKGLTKTQKENAEIKSIILGILGESGSPMTISQLMDDSRLSMVKSNQKMSALLRQLGEDGTREVVKSKDKKTVLFSLADSADDAEYLDREVTV